MQATLNICLNMSMALARENPYGIELVEHDGFFYQPRSLKDVMNMKTQFKARKDDVFVCSGMKTGTTWLKAIVASIMSESKSHVLKEKGVHDLVYNIERSYISRSMPNANTSTIIAEMPSPRLLSTHLPYSALPPQITSLGCRMIYIARNPKDTFVSHWKYLPALQAVFNTETTAPVSREVFFDSFCNGASLFGPFVDHVLSFWNPSRRQSNILFLTYEDMKADSLSYVKKISDFLGQSSLTQEDIRYIDSQCSFQSLSTLDVNKNGKTTYKNANVNNRSFYRKGEVGDWKNHFTPEMSSRINLVVENKFQEAGLFLKYEL
ncbi:hypothetical protein SUGI_0555230 [Cryptomeria japonica]|uniref:cytosolic sulfotransferase 18-like n=1 Tax=Cryptomeria japonica TaxID=3369 RepID=UPI002408B28B|nr:cytosolic sulfotransferase 18-like [Cryptomeria japonica]GLJ28256.1 hypothetical protein SUGI_0555230 [Cryptomeria japonica]